MPATQSAIPHSSHERRVPAQEHMPGLDLAFAAGRPMLQEIIEHLQVVGVRAHAISGALAGIIYYDDLRLFQPPEWCLGDMDCSGGSPTFDDIKHFSAAIGSESAWREYYRSRHDGADPPCSWLMGDFSAPPNGVEFSDIKPFAASIGQPCIPFAP